jgi:transposase-like protein
MESRKTYSYEYKISIINKILNENENPSKVAEKYSLNKNMLFRWIKEFKNNEKDIMLFPGHGKAKDINKKLNLKEIKHLKNKNEIIKETKLLIKKGSIRNDLYNFIYANRKKYSVRLMVEVFKIGRSSYYKWLKNNKVVQ